MRFLSVRLSVKCVHCDKTEEKSVQIFIPCERSFSLFSEKKNGGWRWLLISEILGQLASAGGGLPYAAVGLTGFKDPADSVFRDPKGRSLLSVPNPKFMLTEPEEVLHCRNTDFQLFLWPWPSTIWTWEIYWMCKKWSSWVGAFESYRITDIMVIIHQTALWVMIMIIVHK